MISYMTRATTFAADFAEASATPLRAASFLTRRPTWLRCICSNCSRGMASMASRVCMFSVPL